jgi:hypothetical protein
MAIKTFSSGEVLTAADTNTYLNNGGLVYIKEQAVGSGVASVLVTSAFTSAYQNYKIIYTGGSGSGTHSIGLRFGIGATMTITNYFGVAAFQNLGASAWQQVQDNASNVANNVGGGGTSHTIMSIDVYNPQFVANTYFQGPFFQSDYGRFGICSYGQLSSTQFTSFTLYALPGTFTGGTIYIYGYRKA